MDEATKKYFEDDENVKKEIMEARRAFAKGTTFDQYENLIKGLLIMSFYCSDKMTTLVQATIDEAQARQFYTIGSATC